MGLIYLDSCILIYAVEDETDRGETVRERLDATDEVVAISPLVMLECLIGPQRADDAALEYRYGSAFNSCQLINLGVPAFMRAAQLRAKHNLSTPDSLHLAAAQLSGCTELWTNDAGLTRAAPKLAVNVVSSNL